jgi:hypothetical protein
MKTYSRFLILTLLIWSSFASAGFHLDGVTCIGKNDKIAPSPKTYQDSDGNTHDTDAFKAWKDEEGVKWVIRQNYGCCEKLDLNTTSSVCEDRSIIDDSKRTCSAPGSHGQCADLPGLGCYPMSEDDMFDTDSEVQADIDAMAEKEKKYEQQQAIVLAGGDPKEEGERCFANKQCESYNCSKFKCVAPINICRFAANTETAPGSIKCDEPLTKNGMNICGDGSVAYYNGPLGNIIVGQKQIKPGEPSATRCEYELYPTGKDSSGKPLTTFHIEGAINLGIKTIRSMEWLYSTVSNSDNVDCLYTREYMKQKIGALVERRKDILKAYNEDMLFIESNFKIIASADIKNEASNMATQVTTLCADQGGGYELTTLHDIASRKATGLDFMCYMKERNLLHKEYETAMNTWVADLNLITDAYRTTVFNWGEKDKHWTTGDKSYEWKNRDCRDWPSWHKKIKRRWTQRYKVFGRRDKNEAAINKSGVSEYLTFIGDSSSPSEFKKNYYLLDPLMPGGANKGVSFSDYGRRRNFNGDDDRALGMGLSTILGGVVATVATGGIGAATYISSTIGSNRGYLIDMHNEYGPRLEEYLKSLRKDLPPENFIHEPEIRGSYEMRGCMEGYLKPGTLKDEGANSAKCEKFKEYMDDIKDFAFAQFLAYSKHNKKKYKNYFKSPGSWRQRLFNRYDVDLANLQSYYIALSGENGLRKKQDDCLRDLIKGITQDFGTTEGTGVTTGLSNYYNQTSSNYLGTGGGPKNYNTPKIKGDVRAVSSFKLSAINLAFKGSGGKKDSIYGNTGAGSGAANGVVGNGALAARLKAMEAANAKAVANGVDLNAKSKELEDNMAKAGLYSGGAGSMAGRGGSSSGSASGAGSGTTHKATIGDGEMDADGAAKNAGNGKGAASGSGSGAGFGAAAGANAGSLSGIVAGSGSGNSSGADSGSGSGQDASGMSDEEKDRMAANYDRTKGEYKTNEDDSLFRVVSKTYVRNLDKILTRKKKLDEEAPAVPAQP